MEKLTELGVFAAAVGERVDGERLETLGAVREPGSGSYADCIHCVVLSTPGWMRLFALSPAMARLWHEGGITFGLHLYLHDDRIAGGRILKYRHTDSAGYEMEPTRQELLLLRKILEYITKKGEKE